jgi:hypothetical protein
MQSWEFLDVDCEFIVKQHSWGEDVVPNTLQDDLEGDLFVLIV